jgi:hypothetical protein
MRFPMVMSRSGRPARGWLAVMVAVFGLLAGCIPQGNHTVSSFGAGGISPGLWRTLGGDTCSWARREANGTALSQGLAHTGPRSVQVDPSDGSFEQQGCLPFWQQPGPFATPLRDPFALTPFGEGDWMVNADVTSGWYYYAPGAPPGGTCRWTMVNGWHHVAGEVLQYGIRVGPGPMAVLIPAPHQGGNPGLIGFTSHGCGSWTPTNAIPALNYAGCPGPAVWDQLGWRPGQLWHGAGLPPGPECSEPPTDL